MTTENKNTTPSQDAEAQSPLLQVAPSPHMGSTAFTTQRMMLDVIIALLPALAMSVYLFREYAIRQIGICVVACLLSELLFVHMRAKPITVKDFSAVVTGLILALSLPATAPWYIAVIASVAAIGMGKIIFGGLGMNIFNPAMVGRAFVMISFAGVMGAAAYERAGAAVDAMSRATPLNALKQAGVFTPAADLFWGLTNGSLGETSALACLLGGIYLCWRRTASWEIPAGMIGAVVVLSGIADFVGSFGGHLVLHHLLGGALLFGAFFIATDPVTSPLTARGKFIFGCGTGALVMLFRLFSGYPEGVMFAVLLMNGLTPMINRWTIPKTLGEY